MLEYGLSQKGAVHLTADISSVQLHPKHAVYCCNTIAALPEFRAPQNYFQALKTDVKCLSRQLAISLCILSAFHSIL